MTDDAFQPQADSSAAQGVDLTRAEVLRYARHLALPDMGRAGQQRLKGSRVLCVGAGGLGSPLALYLAAAGVGTLGLVDFDKVDVTNLQRQILHGTKDVGRSKLESAVERLSDVNPHVQLIRHDERLTRDNALRILQDYDIVVDGTDNFPTRYLVNDACVMLGKPNVYGSVSRWDGQISLFAVPGGPCYRCLFREPPAPELVQNCAEGGVLGVLPGIIGSMQAAETIKWLLGVGEPLVGRLLLFDGLGMLWREIELRRNPDCPVCGDEPTQTELIDYEVFCGLSATSSSGEASSDPEIDAVDLFKRLSDPEPPLVVDVRESWEWEVGNLQGLGAIHVPLQALERRMADLPTNRTLVVVCRTGGRSGRAARALLDHGFRDVLNLRGGLKAWAETELSELVVA